MRIWTRVGNSATLIFPESCIFQGSLPLPLGARRPGKSCGKFGSRHGPNFSLRRDMLRYAQWARGIALEISRARPRLAIPWGSWMPINLRYYFRPALFSFSILRGYWFLVLLLGLAVSKLSSISSGMSTAYGRDQKCSYRIFSVILIFR